MLITNGESDAEKEQARANIGAGTGNGNSDISRIIQDEHDSIRW